VHEYTTSQGTTALLKDASVDMQGMHKPSVDPIIDAAGPIYNELGYELIITSAADGEHSDTSLHYPWHGRFDGGQALDLRCAQWHGYPKQDRLEIERRLRQRLPAEYDVVGQSLGHTSHIHVERDLS
jgi:hypothetical protein